MARIRYRIGLGLGALALALAAAAPAQAEARPAEPMVQRAPLSSSVWAPTAARVRDAAGTRPVYVSEQVGGGSAAGGGGGAGDLAMQIQNPVADLISLPIQANLDQGFGPEDHAYRWTINVQPVIPIKLNRKWSVISRTIVPVIVREGLLAGEDDTAGIGDIVQSFFFSPRDSKRLIWGVGPVVLFPSATDDVLGSRKWGLGPTAVALKQTGPWTFGCLANHIWSFADKGKRTETLEDPEVNATFIQPFLSYTFPSAFALTLNTESTYDWERDAWNIPINVIASQVTTVCRQPVSLGLGFRYWAETPDGGPEWGVRLQVTLLFPKK